MYIALMYSKEHNHACVIVALQHLSLEAKNFASKMKI